MIDSGRVIDDLRELARRTGDESGAQRLCWTDTWTEARGFLRELLDEIGIEAEVDEAGNMWSRLEGAEPDAPAVAVGSHLDSVPDGGWLDGALGVMAAIGALRDHAGADPPPRPIFLVDWADEEGARFGRSLFGSSAFAGTMDPSAVSGLRDAGGRGMADVLAEHGVELSQASECGWRAEDIGAYLELHIEQGPVLENDGAALAAVAGCQGTERLRFRFEGQAGHAGTTPMEMRRDAGLAAAACAIGIAELPGVHGGVATTGEVRLEPGIITAVAGAATLGCDLRNPDAASLAEILEEARHEAAVAATLHGCEHAEEHVWRIEPISFDPELVEHAAAVCEEATGSKRVMTSGALHDAAEVARVVPAAMLFAPSAKGVSHAAAEDTPEDDLRTAIDAYGALVRRVLGE